MYKLATVTALVGAAAWLLCGVVPLRAEPTRAPSASLETDLGQRLVERAKREERISDASWDQATRLSLALRARIELLRTNLFGPADRSAVLAEAQALAAVILGYEAHGARGQAYARSAYPQSGRGWGSSRPLAIGAVSSEIALDAYSTAITLSGLVELALYAAEHEQAETPAGLYATVTSVMDAWIDQQMFRAADGEYAWEKIASAHPQARHYIVFNTDALFARDLLRLSELASARGDAARAERYREIVRSVATRLRERVVRAVVSGEKLQPDAWRYGLVIAGDGKLTAQRIEDTNHASYTLDFLSLAAESGVRTRRGELAITAQELEQLASLLTVAVFPHGLDAHPAYELYVDPDDTRRSGPRGKPRALAFARAAQGAQQSREVTWWKELGGSARSLDLGLSIRTSWGWSEAASGNAALRVELGRYLSALLRDPAELGACNTFLSAAVWYRIATAGRS